METFSLEDDECHELFITQSGSNKENGDEFGSISAILGDGSDFSLPCVSIMQSQYSDISDDDDLVFPLSQKRSISQDTNNSVPRLVHYLIL